MIKALLAALCFVLVGFALVNGSFALPDMQRSFQQVAELFENGFPEMGGAGTPVHVALVTDDQPQSIYPGSSASSAFRVENRGEGDVYFRLVYTIGYEAESWPKLDIRFSPGSGFIEHPWQDVSSGNMPYKMKVFTYKTALPAGASSPEVGLFIAMDASVTSEQMARYGGDFIQTRVLAIDPAPFAEKGYTTAEQALDMALPLRSLNPF